METLPPYFSFYREMVEKLLVRGVVNPNMSTLVLCGGETDKKIFEELGFTDVTISNLDTRMNGNEFAPYKWSFQNAESLTWSDDSFDLVVVCAGLHHCHSPHRALLE